MKKNHLSVLLILSLFFTIGATTLQQPGRPGDDDDKAENLKVLPKDIKEKQLDSVMAHFCISLGVRCNFCHAPGADAKDQHRLDFASDKKEEKNRAREMMKMTAYLNANFFNENHSDKTDTIHEVVCYTCHRGGHEPDAKVFLALIDSTIQAHRNRRPPPPGGQGEHPEPPKK